MPDQLQCPECGMKLGKGSTFCINCGHRVIDNSEQSSSDMQSVKETTEMATLPPLEETELEEIKTPPDSKPDTSEPDALPPVDELSWEEGISKTPPADKMPIKEEDPAPVPVANDVIPKAVDIEELTWEGEMDEIKEGMPFKEVEPPRVVAEEIDMTSAMDHLFPDKKDDATRDAVAHLFPEGRGSTSSSFIDVVVGTPSRVGITKPMKELDSPSCPSCGAVLTADEFEYPPYVFEAMGKARMEQGEDLLKSDEHEKAIEAFEMAKVLFERAGNEKAVAESTKKVDEGYDEMAKFHYDQGESHLKEDQFEWAVVQFRKARELYMFSTDSKKRAKCSEKVRDSYARWGKLLEKEGDDLAKSGNTRDALLKYQEAAGKYREGGAKKSLKRLDKKIRKA